MEICSISSYFFFIFMDDRINRWLQVEKQLSEISRFDHTLVGEEQEVLKKYFFFHRQIRLRVNLNTLSLTKILLYEKDTQGEVEAPSYINLHISIFVIKIQ